MTESRPVDQARAIELRAACFTRIRDFFGSRGFLEVDTPLLVATLPTEAFVEPFEVELRRGGRVERRYLPPSPEAALKRTMALLERDVFEIGHAFRNGEEEGPLHRAHFRMLEWYRRNADYEQLMEDTTALLEELAALFAEEGVAGPPALRAPRPRRLPIPDAFAEYLDHPIRGPEDLGALVPLAAQRGHGRVDDWEEAFHALVAVDVQPHLGHEEPVYLCDYPAGVASQARPHPDRPWLAQQFEVFVNGIELGNSYSELVDAREQAARWEAEAQAITRAGRRTPPRDDGLLAALDQLPQRAAGGSLGLDRLIMVWLGAGNLDEVRPVGA